MVRLEQARLEKEKVEGRIKMLEQYREEEKAKFIDKISKLTGRYNNNRSFPILMQNFIKCLI
jgi:flagellar biosynthesis chaperone FliJ